MVIEYCIIPDDIVITGFIQSEAQIDIVISYSEVFSESAYLIELGTADHKAGSCNSQPVIVQLIAAKVITGTVTHASERMHGAASDAHNTAMLNKVSARIEKLGADSAGMWQFSLTEHPSQPLSVYYLYIVIQEQEIFTRCIFRTDIAHVREIEFLRLIYIVTADRIDQFLILCFILVRASVINNYYLIILIIGLGSKRIEALLQQVVIILGRNYDADLGIIPAYVIDPPLVHVGDEFDLPLQSASGKGILFCSFCSIKRIRLCLSISGCGLAALAPMVQDLGYVSYPLIRGLLRESQDKVIVLRTFITESEASDSPCYLSPVYAKMAGVHQRHKSIRRPVRLKVRLNMF